MDNRAVRKGAISLDEMLNDIEVPSLDVPDLDGSFVSSEDEKDLFSPKKRAAWKDVQQAEARCDFAPNKVRISYRNPAFGIISLWKKSVYGRTLTDIKSDPDMVEKFAEDMNTLIRQILGNDKWNTKATVAQDLGQGATGTTSTTISVEATDEVPAPFYVGTLETEDGDIDCSNGAAKA